MKGIGPFLVVASICIASSAACDSPNPACAPSGTLSFICGVENPEDIVPIPGTHWLIAGGLKRGAGIKLIDTLMKTQTPLFRDSENVSPSSPLSFPCSPSPDPQLLNAHGLYLRQDQPDHYKLYAVSHSPVEAIQIFSVELTVVLPRVRWIGCVPTPTGYIGNGVAAFSDGSIIVTVSDRPGTTKAQELAGIATGIVMMWKPGWQEFHMLTGTEMAGDNGVEISKDEKEFYVAGFGGGNVAVFSRADPTKPLRIVKSPGFMPDNLRWSDNRLIAAGPMYDEPACGGTRLAVLGIPSLASCHRGYIISELDPVSMTWTTLAYSEPNPKINGVSVGVIADETIWIGSNSAAGLAYCPWRQIEPH